MRKARGRLEYRDPVTLPERGDFGTQMFGGSPRPVSAESRLYLERRSIFSLDQEESSSFSASEDSLDFDTGLACFGATLYTIHRPILPTMIGVAPGGVRTLVRKMSARRAARAATGSILPRQ